MANIPGTDIPIPFTGDGTPQQAPAPPPDTSTRDAFVQALAASHGGVVGQPAPQYIQGTGSNQGTQFPTGYDLYTFADGTTVEANPSGQFQNLKIADKATQTPADVAARQGQLIIGNNVYVKNPTPDDGRGPYVLDTTSQNNLQISTAKTVADTQLASAQAAVQQANAQLASNPQDQAAQIAKVQADANLAQAQAASSTLNAQSTAARVPSQNLLEQAQAGAATQNAATSLLNAQSTAARVGSQNALEQAQAVQAAQTAATAAGRLPSQIALDTAQAASQQAAAQAALSKMNEPIVQSTGTGPTYTYYDPRTGQMTTAANPAYQPTDPGRMTVQLKQQADQQWQQLQGQVASGQLTSDQAASQFDQYWNENVEPMKGSIAQAQAAQQSALAQQQAQTQYYQAQAANIPATLAQNASDQAQRNALAMMPYVVGASAATTPGVTRGARGFPVVNTGQVMQNATFSLPNLQEIGRQGAAAALANVSPTAAMHSQMPGPLAQPQQPFDLSGMLNVNNYGFPQVPPPVAPPVPAPAAAAPAPQTYGPLTSNDWWGNYQPSS